MFKKTREKINQNEYVIIIKKIWANKRYRSIFVLLLYFIFFFVIITGLKSGYQENVDNENNNQFSYDAIKEQYNNLRDYSYEIFVNETSVLTGELNNGINTFIYNEEKYTLINEQLYKEELDNLKKIESNNDDVLLSIVDKINLNDLINYVSGLKVNPKIDANSFRLDYEIPNSYFSLEEEGTVKVSVLGQTKVDEIIIDLTSYMKETYIIKIKVSDNND